MRHFEHLHDGELLTPALELGLLAGRTRAMILDLADRLDHRTSEVAFTVNDLLGAEEVFICGSVKEVVPVISIDGQQIATGRPGQLTLQLQKEYRREALGT
jgi:branched-subunit amino acid aminotransferase/4-amino-4-deoxychorismate lyase